MIKIGLVGYNGKMGRSIAAESLLHPEVNVVVGSRPKNKDDAISAEDLAEHKVTLYRELDKVFELSDVVIDFSNPRIMEECLHHAVAFKTPLVSGTTGHSNAHPILKQAAKEVPILHSANMSCGINLIMHMFNQLNTTMLEDMEGNILEMHHSKKKDLPSGTAIALKNQIQHLLKQDIQISSMRMGYISGGHSIFLSGYGEMIEIKHTSNDRKTYSLGAINAAKWLHNKSSGLYSMLDLMQ